MITIKNYRELLAILILGLALVLPGNHRIQAATTPNIPEDCNPPPEDPELLLLCNAYYIEHPQPRTYEPGTDPANPVAFPMDGLAGIATAYSPKSNLILVVAGKFVSDSQRQLWGVMADPETLAPKGGAFQLAGGLTGNPKIAYAPGLDKFLVVWEDGRPCGERCRSTYGRFISGSGTPEGPDFVINSGEAFLADVVYDSLNKVFVVGYELDGVFFRTVDLQAKVSGQVKLPLSFQYQGQMGVTVNTNKNEYWFAYAVVVSGGDTPKEDDRIMLSRVNAKNLQVIGEPVQLSQTRIGRNAFAGAHIAYSPKGGGAMAVWGERGREGISGEWGRSIYDDGTLSGEYPVITVGTNPISEGFGVPSIQYNEWTDSFFVPSGDWDGNAWITEIDLSGLIYDNQPALSPTAMAPSPWARLFGMKTAQAAAVGSFNITTTVTPYGAATFASKNYQTVVATKFQSSNAVGTSPIPAPPPPGPTTPRDLTALPKLINQIFVWSLGLGALLALLMVVLGGYYYMTSAGNAENATKGVEMIWGAVIGLALLFGSYLLLSTINPDLVKFNIDSLRGLDAPATTTTTPSTIR